MSSIKNGGGPEKMANAPFHYQESMKYINEFYEKYNGGSSRYQAENSFIQEEADGAQ